jgi:Ran GTPase-activating protein (RanGAP) involved in mRNA processing and transport
VQVNTRTGKKQRVRRANIGIFECKSLDEFVTRAWPLSTRAVVLHLSGNRIDVFGAARLADNLQHCPSLMQLDLSRNSIRDDGATRLADNLQHCPALTTLDLDSNSIGDDGATRLADNLQNCPELTKLNLGSNSIGDVGATRLADNLQHCPSLTRLYLSSNSIGADGATKLADNLQHCPSLTLLNLRGNSIGDVGATRLADNLQHCPALTELHLGDNSIGDVGATRLADNLRHCPSLTVLNLGSNAIGAVGATRLADNLQYCPSLTVLDLSFNWFNWIGDAGATSLADNLQHCPALTKLTLRGNRIGDVGATRLADNLQHCPSLTRLDLVFNKIGDAGVARFADFLVSSSSRVKIDMTANPASKESMARMELASHPELRKHLDEPSEPPLCNALCVVGFQGVGKTALVGTWRRRGSRSFFGSLGASGGSAAAMPSGDPDVDDRDSKTAGMTMQPITLRGRTTTADVTVVDCAGHMEYYLSHEVVLRCCPGAVFVVLFRLDRAEHPILQHDEVRRLMYWLKYVATLRQNDRQGGDAPKVFVVGTRFDVVAPADRVQAVERANNLFHAAKARFDGVLIMPQERVYCVNCTNGSDNDLADLTDQVTAACEQERKAERRMAPAVCVKARAAVAKARAAVAAEIAAFEKKLQSQQRAVKRGNAGAAPPPPPVWMPKLAPVMEVAAFAEHVLGTIKVNVSDGSRSGTPVDVRPSSAVALLRVILSYLHDSGDILWFEEEGELGDTTVILAPDLFCSIVIGAVFKPANGRGFGVPTVGGNGAAAVPVGAIATTLQLHCGIDASSTRRALQVLERLELCHRTVLVEDGGEAYMFPGAISAASGRPPDVMQWMGARYFCAGRQFELAPDVSSTLIFRPGLVPALQCWALRHYPGSTLWAGGVHIGLGLTCGTAVEGAEAAVQLHCHAAAEMRDPARGSDPGDHMVVVIVRSRGDDVGCRAACELLFNELCEEVRRATGLHGDASLVERGLPPLEIAERPSPLDIVDQGHVLLGNGPTRDAHVRVWGRTVDESAIWQGGFVEPQQNPWLTPFPREWGDHRPGSGTMLVPLDPTSAEFRVIQANMARSMPEAAANIHRIDRVQNPALWIAYSRCRREIANEMRDSGLTDDATDAGAANEVMAWHSTGPQLDPAVICTHRLDGFQTHRTGVEPEWHVADGKKVLRQVHNAGSKSYGTGAYFSEHPIYGDAIFPHTRPADAADAGRRQIIVAKIVKGHVIEHGSEIPARRPAWASDGFHSRSGTEDDMRFVGKRIDKLRADGHFRDDHPFQRILDNGHEYGRQYIVHRSSQAYPAYLVTYTNPNNP